MYITAVETVKPVLIPNGLPLLKQRKSWEDNVKTDLNGVRM
jgi:hypothetical protein